MASVNEVQTPRLQIAAGIGCAVTGHVIAAGPWLYVVAIGPDTVFMAALLTGALELAHFVVCISAGVGLSQSRWQHFGTGLLAGWFTGLLAVLCGGTLLMVAFAAL